MFTLWIVEYSLFLININLHIVAMESLISKCHLLQVSVRITRAKEYEKCARCSPILFSNASKMDGKLKNPLESLRKLY